MNKFKTKLNNLEDHMDNSSISIIPDIQLNLNRPHILYGKECSSKSFFAYYLSICIASGRSDIFSHVEKGKVVIVDGDNLANNTAIRIIRMINNHALNEKECEEIKNNIELYNVNGEKEYNEAWPSILESCKSAKLLIIDNLSSIRDLNGSENDPSLGIELDRLKEVIKLGCIPILIHHSGHNGDKPRGSSVLGGKSENLYRITKFKSHYKFEIKNDRNNSELKEFNYILEDCGKELKNIRSEKLALKLINKTEENESDSVYQIFLSGQELKEYSKIELAETYAANLNIPVDIRRMEKIIAKLKTDGKIKQVGSGSKTKYIAV